MQPFTVPLFLLPLSLPLVFYSCFFILSSSSSWCSLSSHRRCSASWFTAFLNWFRIFIRWITLTAAFAPFLEVRIFLMLVVRRGYISSPLSVDHFRHFSRTCATVMLPPLEQLQFKLRMSGTFILYRKALKLILLVRSCVSKTLSCFLSLMCVSIVYSVGCDHKFLE